MEIKTNRKTIKLRTALVFCIVFIISIICTCLLNRNQIKEEQMKAWYTAEATVNRIESQINQYLVASDFLKNIIEDGVSIEAEDYANLCRLLQDETHVVEAFELAAGGTVSQVYPVKGNEEAFGLDMLEHPERKKEARLARDSGQYTIAGPFELVQGGTGALLFDPIYTSDSSGNEQFWGFSILVLNWGKFVDRLGLDSLENAGYDYQIWKRNMTTEEDVTLAQCEDINLSSALEVACEVPNDTWYFEISPKKGWISNNVVWADFLFSLVVAALVSLWYWQFELQRYKDQVYARKIERSAEKARRANEAKTRFLFNMSHDIRTPMNAIIGFSDLLEEHIDEHEKAVNYIQKIKYSSEFLLSLINDMLEMARIESGKASLNPGIVNIKEFMESLEAVFEPATRKKALQYSCELNIRHDMVICDETKMREILLNVLGNSVKYTPDGGKVTLRVTELPDSAAGYAATRIVVEDTGIGMSEEYLPHIFEEFTREHSSTESKVVGSGLGLPIVKSLVELMNGTIKVESEAGKGTKTTIELSFPLPEENMSVSHEAEAKCPDTISEEEIPSENESITGKQKEFTGKRILLAEDNDLNAEIAMTLLEENGFTVERAEDGQICVNLLKDKPEHYYDLILMDIQMPNMNGYEASKIIREMGNSRSQIPIIAMTANAFDEDKKKAMGAGMNAHIAKPFDLRVLLDTMKRILGSYSNTHQEHS